MASMQQQPLPSEKQLKQSLKSLKYTQNALVAKHIMTTVEAIPDLKPSIRECTYSDPSIRGSTLMQLAGNMTCNDAEESVKIPIRVWLNKGYPRSAPVVYINLAPNMEFINVPYVKTDGKIDVGQIMTWKEGKSELCLLIQQLCTEFSEQCPIRQLKKRSTSNQFSFRQLQPSHSTLSLRDTSRLTPNMALFKPTNSSSHDQDALTQLQPSHSTFSLRDTSRLTPNMALFKPTNSSSHDQDALIQLQAEIEEKNTKIKSLEDTLEDTRAKVGYYRNQATEMESKLKQQKTSFRGSFSTGVFDALMQQQDRCTEKQEMELCKRRMEKMVDELTELRERLGVLKVDKEEVEERLGTTVTEYERIKYIHHQLIKERRYLIARQQQLTRQNQSASDDDSDTENEEMGVATEEEMGLDEASEDEQTTTNTSDQYEQGSKEGEEAEQPGAGILITVSEETTPTDEAMPIAKTDKINEKAKYTLNNDQSKNTQDNEIQKLRETIHSQETLISTLTKTLKDFQEEENASTQLLKKLLDDAMRKLRRYEVCIDKEEQLEKQKNFLQTQLERSTSDRFEAERKLREENWQTRQKLKEVMNRAEWLEHRFNSAEQSPSHSSLEEEEEGTSKRGAGGDEMSSVLEHLNVLLSN